MPALLLLTGPQAGLRYEIVDEVILGRSPSCSIALDDAKVSRRHVRISLGEEGVTVADLQSRNGTTVNGEKLEDEVPLLPGDRIQVGDTTVLFAPGAAASLSDLEIDHDIHSSPVEELLPVTGLEAALYNTSVALFSSSSESMALSRAAEELLRSLDCEVGAALLGGVDGLLTAAVVGASHVEVPRGLVRGALDRKETGSVKGRVCAPLLASGGAPFGILYAERKEPFTLQNRKTISALGRMVGEALTLMRARGDQRDDVMPVGSTRAMKTAVAQLRRAAALTAPVVLQGELGTGRHLLAKYLHLRSARALGPFVQIDCRASASEVEDVLFGRTSSAGIPPSPSALLMADGGSLFLANLDSLPRQFSSRLTRLLAHKTAPSRQGGEEKIDVRILASVATSVGAAVAHGDLDAELAKVLGDQAIQIPSLRDRKADVPLIIDHFLAAASLRFRKPKPSLSPDAIRLLTDYSWPGNVAELRGVVERFALLYSGSEVSTLQLPPELREGGSLKTEKQTLGQRVAKLERDAIVDALRESGGKKIKAAAVLGISRPTLDKKIEEHQLKIEKRRI